VRRLVVLSMKRAVLFTTGILIALAGLYSLLTAISTKRASALASDVEVGMRKSEVHRIAASRGCLRRVNMVERTEQYSSGLVFNRAVYVGFSNDVVVSIEFRSTDKP
jgi:hypothetical protein